MPSELLVKIEIVILIISFLYVIYYVAGKIYRTYFAVKKAIIKEDLSNVKVALNKVDLKAREENYKKSNNTKKLNTEELIQVNEIIKKVRLKSSKGHNGEAKGLIIEGLAIDKFNKDLNSELAIIYEKEGNYQNAEYIYKDLLEHVKDNGEFQKRLAYVYYAQGKLDEALKAYQKMYKKNAGDEEVINMLSEVTYDLKDWKTAIKYLNEYLKFKPRDIPKLTMKAICYEELRDFKEALAIHKKILEIQPYNTFSRDKIRELGNLS